MRCECGSGANVVVAGQEREQEALHALVIRDQIEGDDDRCAGQNDQLCRSAGRFERERPDGREESVGRGRADGIRLPGEGRHAGGEVREARLNPRRVGGERAELVDEGGDDEDAQADDKAKQSDENEAEREGTRDAMSLQPRDDGAEGAGEHEGDDEDEDDLPQARDEQDARDNNENQENRTWRDLEAHRAYGWVIVSVVAIIHHPRIISVNRYHAV